jgi:hypothetical protein
MKFTAVLKSDVVRRTAGVAMLYAGYRLFFD